MNIRQRLIIEQSVLAAGDCLELLRDLPDGVCNFTFTSPPYEDSRTYGIGFKLRGQAWVDWMVPRVVEFCRVTNGLVFINMAGKVKQFKYSPVVEWLVTDLTRNHGLVLGPQPYVYHRVGIPGSGSKHYHRRDWEPIYGFARPECLPVQWSNNTAFGHPPKWAPGGEMSNRKSDGSRVNKLQRGNPKGTVGYKLHTKARQDGDEEQIYFPPAIANPGNVIHLKVGGGLMGDKLAHENEAPFPESLIERFIAWYCPPGGLVLDPFCGSGTVPAVARKMGREYLGIDIRESQIAICRERVTQSLPAKTAG